MRQLEVLRSENPSTALTIEATPLGTAFALSEGWSPVPSGAKLRLSCGRAVLASMPEPPEPLPPPLLERFNMLTGSLPTFTLEGYRTRTGRVPVCIDVPTLISRWETDTGRPRSEMPEVSVVDLRLLVARMLAQPDDWRRLTFCPAARQLEAARRLGVACGDEPPPLS